MGMLRIRKPSHLRTPKASRKEARLELSTMALCFSSSASSGLTR